MGHGGAHERQVTVTTLSSSCNPLSIQTCRCCGQHSHIPYHQHPDFQNDQGPVVNSCQNAFIFIQAPHHCPHPICGTGSPRGLLSGGPPCARDPGLLREGSRLYSYLLRGNITALKPHNLLPHPAGSMFWRRPSRSPPTLATGRQSHMAQLAQGRGGSGDSGSARKAWTHQMDQGRLQCLNPPPQGQWPTVQLQALPTGGPGRLEPSSLFLQGKAALSLCRWRRCHSTEACPQAGNPGRMPGLECVATLGHS